MPLLGPYSIHHQRRGDDTSDRTLLIYSGSLRYNSPVFRELVGETAALSPNAIVRLKQRWEEEYRVWRSRMLAEYRYAYIWADGVYLGAGVDREKTALLCVVGARETVERRSKPDGAAGGRSQVRGRHPSRTASECGGSSSRLMNQAAWKEFPQLLTQAPSTAKCSLLLSLLLYDLRLQCTPTPLCRQRAPSHNWRQTSATQSPVRLSERQASDSTLPCFASESSDDGCSSMLRSRAADLATALQCGLPRTRR